MSEEPMYQCGCVYLNKSLDNAQCLCTLRTENCTVSQLLFSGIAALMLLNERIAHKLKETNDRLERCQNIIKQLQANPNQVISQAIDQSIESNSGTSQPPPEEINYSDSSSSKTGSFNEIKQPIEESKISAIESINGSFQRLQEPSMPNFSKSVGLSSINSKEPPQLNQNTSESDWGKKSPRQNNDNKEGQNKKGKNKGKQQKNNNKQAQNINKQFQNNNKKKSEPKCYQITGRANNEEWGKGSKEESKTYSKQSQNESNNWW